jgi:hypothetical protein
MTNDHDALFRHVFAQPEHAASLLRSVLPAAVAAAVDWRSLQLTAGTSVDEGLRNRHADLLFTARLAGAPALLYVLVEHKSADEPLAAFQLLRYVVRAFDRWLAEHLGATGLPPIVPILVHHGPKPWASARSVADLVALAGVPGAAAAALRPLQPDLRFLLDDLAATPEAELAGREASVLHRLSLLLLQFLPTAAPADPEAVVERWRALFQAVWAHPDGRAAIYALFSYLALRLDVEPERFVAAAARIHEGARQVGKSLADRLHEQGFQAGIAQGEAQGEARGEARGKADALLTILRARFGEVPAALAVQIRASSPDALDDLLARAATAPTLAAVFA